MKDKFNGFDYKTTLKYFKYTLKNPNDIRNGETRGEWFTRCHGISGKEFAKIIKVKESQEKVKIPQRKKVIKNVKSKRNTKR